MTLDREYLERRERESIAVAPAAASRGAFIVHTRLDQLYRNELEQLDRMGEERSDREAHPLYAY